MSVKHLKGKTLTKYPGFIRVKTGWYRVYWSSIWNSENVLSVLTKGVWNQKGNSKRPLHLSITVLTRVPLPLGCLLRQSPPQHHVKGHLPFFCLFREPLLYSTSLDNSVKLNGPSQKTKTFLQFEKMFSTKKWDRHPIEIDDHNIWNICPLPRRDLCMSWWPPGTLWALIAWRRTSAEPWWSTWTRTAPAGAPPAITTG